MKLSELIARHGDERVEFQNLDECFLAAQSNKRGVKITFGTSAVTATALMHQSHKLCLIVWLDRERVKEIMAQDKKEEL